MIDALKVQELFYVGAAAWDNSFVPQTDLRDGVEAGGEFQISCSKVCSTRF